MIIYTKEFSDSLGSAVQIMNARGQTAQINDLYLEQTKIMDAHADKDLSHWIIILSSMLTQLVNKVTEVQEAEVITDEPGTGTP